MGGLCGLGLALDLDQGRARAGRSTVDAHFTGGQFHFAGRDFADEAAFRAAIGGTAPAPGRLVFGPHVACGAPELLSDGDFSTGTAADWTGVGGSVGVVSGALQVTGSGGSGSGAYRSIAGLVANAGRAYRLSAKVWRETASSVTLGFGAGGGGTANYAQTANLTASTAQPVALYCGGFNPATASIALRNFSNPSTGTYWADDLSLREAVPYAGFTPGLLCGIVEARTPASGGAGGIVLQTDDNAEFNGNWLERNFIRLVWDASQHLRLIVSFGGSGTQVEQVNLDLGLVPAGTDFAAGLCLREGSYLGLVLGQAAQRASTGTFPGLAALRLGSGRSSVSGLWAGSVSRLRLFSRAMEEEELTAQMAEGGIVAWGDSLTAGAGATGGSTGGFTFPKVAESLFSPPRPVLSQGIGGQSSTQIAARMNGVPLTVSLAGDAIPASGPVAVTTRSVDVLAGSGGLAGVQRGWLGGIEGVFSADAEGEWSFTRSEAGAAVPVPPGSRFVCGWGQHLRGLSAWLWLGRNGAQAGHSVVGDIAAAVQSLGHRRYLVGALLPSAADGASALAALAAINAQLAAAYGPRFVDLVALLMAGADGSPEDASDVAAGLVPRSLRSDHLHLNDAGYARVAEGFHAAHLAINW